MFQINIQILTRAAMNTGTPRFGDWTYHHVLPVRLYYATASLIIRVVTHSECWKTTKLFGRNTLISMCNNQHNKNNIRIFLDDNDEDSVTNDSVRDVAKLCASPPFGGFPGPNPGECRTDDPKDGIERHRPRSADQAWWECLMLIHQELFRAFNQIGMPGANTIMTSNKEIHEWCQIVEAICGYMYVSSTAGAPAFEYRDWLCDDGSPWTILPENRTNHPIDRGQLRLRLSGEQRGYIATTETPIDALKRRGGFVFLARTDDCLNRATPP